MTNGWTLTVRNFRNLRDVEWSPSGVCLLVGPNGSGKSSILGALDIGRRGGVGSAPHAGLSAGDIELRVDVGSSGAASSSDDKSERGSLAELVHVHGSRRLVSARELTLVVDAARDAFPDHEIDAEMMTINGLPVGFASDGVLDGVFYLAAVAAAKVGSIVAVDDFGANIHPHAIRSIVESMRTMADERDLTIVLATHSSVAMNAFKGHEDQIYVLDGSGTSPETLADLRGSDWLAHFSLGDLYEHEDFGWPRPRATSV